MSEDELLSLEAEAREAGAFTTDQDIYDRACELYASDDIDVLNIVDSENADDGAWVSALVWVPLPLPKQDRD